MTQPTQEDLELVAKDIFKYESKEISDRYFGGVGYNIRCYYIRNEWVPFYDLPNFYTDDSFTGALVKAVVPLLAKNNIDICFYEKDGEQRFYFDDGSTDPMISLDRYFGDYGIGELNRALIEAWKKIEGEKK